MAEFWSAAWPWLAFGALLYFVVAIIVIRVLCEIAPGGGENNFQPLKWSAEDRWFMLGVGAAWPLWAFLWIPLYIVRSRRKRRAWRKRQEVSDD